MTRNYLVDMVNQKLTHSISSEVIYSDSELLKIIDECIENISDRARLSYHEKSEIRLSVFNLRRKFGIIQPLLDDPGVNEIMVNGTDAIFIEKDGKIEQTSVRFESKDDLFGIIQSMASFSNRSINESSPIVDARLADGSRINAVLNPTAVNGPVLTIRKFSERTFTMENFIEFETVTYDESVFLQWAVESSLNIFVSGGTSSGKTTFLNVLSKYIPEKDRIIVIEDSSELRLCQPNLVRLETRPPNSEGKGEISMRKLIKTALRMRPDRIIVGEVRDESALDMIQALCTGHDGSMSTAHANSAEDVLIRLETMALWEGHVSSESIRRQISSGVDLVVHLERDRDMRRRVKEIVQVCDYESGGIKVNPVFSDGKKIGSYIT
ncbi:MAG: CpaF family protein [Clostridia bacterium]|nr:CpaF family protein [Clostridia bacterium]MBQ8165090.1 CpaF family protein [Clostridia bacterium]